MFRLALLLPLTLAIFLLFSENTAYSFFSGGGVSQTRTVGAKNPVKQSKMRKGNPQTRVYHNPTCSYFKSKRATILFKSPEEAKVSGFRPCNICGG